jgi:hypothetical protein
VAGRTVGVWFAGAGTVSFVPPLEIERANLRRVLHDSAVSGPITSVVLIFADSTLAELERSLTFATGAEVAGSNVPDALEYLVESRDRYADPTLMTALLNDTANGFFAAYVTGPTARTQDEVDPMQAEEVSCPARPAMGNARKRCASSSAPQTCGRGSPRKPSTRSRC